MKSLQCLRMFVGTMTRRQPGSADLQSAVSQTCSLHGWANRGPWTCQRHAECNSAIQQSPTLRYPEAHV